MRREDSETVKTVMEMNVKGRRWSEKPKRKCTIECVYEDMSIAVVCLDDVGDRTKV